MTIHVDKEQEWDPFVKKVMEKLDEILRYQKNFDSEIFDSLNRLEEKIGLIKSNTELQIKAMNTPMNTPKVLKKVK